jgi:hypothetical protein
MALDMTVDTRSRFDRLSKMPTFGFTSVLLRLPAQHACQPADGDFRLKSARVSKLNVTIPRVTVGSWADRETGMAQ